MPFRGRVRRRRRWRRRLVFAGLAGAAFSLRNRRMAANESGNPAADLGEQTNA